MVWQKISPFTSVLQIESIPATDKFALLRSKLCPDILSSNTPIKKISEFISIIKKIKGNWTKTPNARELLTNSFCALTKTSREVFGCDCKTAGELQPSLGAFLWTAAVTTLGCSFKLTYKIALTKKVFSRAILKILKHRARTFLSMFPAFVCRQMQDNSFIVRLSGYLLPKRYGSTRNLLGNINPTFKFK